MRPRNGMTGWAGRASGGLAVALACRRGGESGERHEPEQQDECAENAELLSEEPESGGPTRNAQ